MDTNLEMFLKAHSLQRKHYHKRLSLKEGSSLQPHRLGIILTSKLQHTGERLGSNRGATFE